VSFDAAVFNGLGPILAAKTCVAYIFVRNVGVLEFVAVTVANVARRAPEANVTGRLTLVIRPPLTVLTVRAVVGRIAPGGAAEVVVGILSDRSWQQ